MVFDISTHVSICDAMIRLPDELTHKMMVFRMQFFFYVTTCCFLSLTFQSVAMEYQRKVPYYSCQLSVMALSNVFVFPLRSVFILLLTEWSSESLPERLPCCNIMSGTAYGRTCLELLSKNLKHSRN